VASLAGRRKGAVHLAGRVNAMPKRLLSLLTAACAALALSALPAFASGTAVAHAAAAAHTPRYVFTDLGVLPPGLDSQARALSERGKVVGLADTCPNCGPEGFHAFLWTPDRPGATSGSMTGLGTLRGQAKSLATGINNAGRVVGTSFYPTPDKAFIYNGSLHNLGRLHRGSSTEADGINSAGAVVGASGTANGFDHAFLWVPDKREGVRGQDA
jgi:probable HAF family extracellular repeat protein